MSKIKNFIELVKFEHTLFALPFAYIGAILSGERISLVKLILIATSMIGARTLGMSLNRLIDFKYDAENPRTSDRTLPSGKMKKKSVVLIIVFSFLLLMFSVYSLNTLSLKLSIIPISLLFLYSYTKRFTYFCHIILGIILGFAPLGGWIAITGTISIAPILLGIGIMFWVAGFDIIYACQDFDFDTKEKLHSIPVKFGLKKALRISSVFHIITALILIYVGFLLKQNYFYYIGVFIVVILLIYEHILVEDIEIKKVKKAFFIVNSWISMIMLVFTIISNII